MKYTILDKAFLSLTGEDVFNMLHGITTNDIYKLPEDKCQYHHMLNPSGRYLFDFFIYEWDSGVLIETEKEQVQGLKSKLMMYKLRSKVEIKESSNNYLAVFAEGPLDMAKISSPDPRFNKLGFRNILNSEDAEKLKEDANLEEDETLYNTRRYYYAIPEGRSDFTYEKSLIQEFGVDYLGGIDYDKGCYVGQEVISRTKHVGVVRKKIYGAKSTDGGDLSDFEQGAEIRMDGKRIGNLRSGYGNNAIALVRTQNYEDNKGRDSSIKLGEVEIELHPTEWQG
jgi:folate-binding protein YgfZ